MEWTAKNYHRTKDKSESESRNNRINKFKTDYIGEMSKSVGNYINRLRSFTRKTVMDKGRNEQINTFWMECVKVVSDEVRESIV